MSAERQAEFEFEAVADPVVWLKPFCACVHDCWNCPLKILPDSKLARMEITGRGCFISRLNIMVGTYDAAETSERRR